ncbi:MAG: hypothetical protein C3F19_14650 [Rhodocyclales bacterium]|nr:MAG: hypothetical protein C3F19_14650 [Rhodocyclales bacterium]
MAALIRWSVVPMLAYGLAEGLSRGLNLMALPLMTRLFSTQDFGRIALIMSLVGFVGLLANCGLGNAAHRYYFDRHATSATRASTISAGLWSLVALSFLCVAVAVALAAGAVFFGAWVGRELLWPIIIGLAAVVPIQLLQYGQDVLRLYSAHWQYLFIVVLKTLIAYAIGLSLVYWFDAGLDGYFSGLLLGYLALVPWTIAAMRRDLTLRLERDDAKKLLTYGYPFVIAGFAQWLISSIDLWVLGALRDPAEVGIYSLSLKLAAIVSLCTSAFGLAWSPLILRLHAEHPDYRRIAGLMLTRLATVLFLFAAAVAALVPHLFDWFIPVEYGRPSVLVAILSLSVAIAGTAQITILGMVFEKRSDLIAKMTWVVAGFSVLSCTGLVAWLGLLGAALSNLLVSLMLTASYLLLTQKIHAIEVSRRDMVKLGGLGGLAALLTVGLAQTAPSLEWAIAKATFLVFMFLLVWRKGYFSNPMARSNAD